MMKPIFLSILGVILCAALGHAQSVEDATERSARSEFEDFRKGARREYSDFRREAMKEYAEFVRQAWEDFTAEPPIPRTQVSKIPRHERLQRGWNKAKSNLKRRQKGATDTVPKTKPEPIETRTTPDPQPEIDEKSHLSEPVNAVKVNLYGTPVMIRYDSKGLPRLGAVNENQVADALLAISDKVNDATIEDCQKARKSLALSDWAYLQLLDAVAESLTTDSNQASLLLAYLCMQSGYKVRFAHDRSHLYMLFATKQNLLERPSFTIDGAAYYSLERLPGSLYICRASYPGENIMTMDVNGDQKFALATMSPRTIASDRYPEMSITATVNLNLLDFYNNYPPSRMGCDVMSQWSIYANVPMDEQLAAQIYPQLRKTLEGKTKREGADMLLNMVQKGLDYAVDEAVWGHERSFFPEETLFYPLCDCEDRAILYSRLVRDLLGLDVALVYYPGHLATALYLGEEADGDYIMMNGRKFVVADPTYFNAPIGMTMPNLDNSAAQWVVLN